MTAETDIFQFSKEEKLNDLNYSIWSVRIDLMVRYEKCGDLKTADPPVLSDTPTAAEKAAKKSFEERTNSIIYKISRTISNNYIQDIVDCKTLKELLAKLEYIFDRKSSMYEVTVLQKIFEKKLPSGGDAKTHIREMKDLFHKLSLQGRGFDDGMQARVLLASLPEDYQPLKSALHSYKPEEITLEFICGKIRDEYDRYSKAPTPTTTTDAAMKIINKSEKSHYRHNNDYRHRSNNYNGQAGRNSSSNKRLANVECFQCGKKGHVKAYCRSAPKREENNQPQPNQDKANVAVTKEAAVLDSGASAHMTSEKGSLENYKRVNGRQVVTANKQNIEVQGIGDARVKIGNREMILKNVLHVPELGSSLISIK